MAIRTDFSVDWNADPRVIIISKPSTACTMQDLHDTLAFIQAEPTSMDNKVLVDSSGLEVLDTTTKVGITVTLQNATIGFEARDGTEFGGVNEWTICKLDGGNVVAVDANKIPIEEVANTPFVNVKTTKSSSATLQEQDALQYASYGGEVSIDTTSSYSGTAFPNGTQEYPVNNIQDAVAIGQLKGFFKLRILGNCDLVAGDNVEEFVIYGQNPILSTLNIDTEANVLNCEIIYARVLGALDGSVILRECLIDGIGYVNGYVDKSGLTINPIILGGNSQATFIDCFSNVGGLDTPTIDMGNTGQALAVRGYKGGLRIVNRRSDDQCNIDMDSGHIIIDESCTGEPITCRGVFKLTVEVGATYPNIEGKVLTEQDDLPTLITDKTLALYQNKAVYLDPEVLVSGDGSATSPFKGVQETKDFAEANGILTVYIYSDVIIPSSVKNFTVIGIGSPVVECNGVDLKNTEFIGCELRGTYTQKIKATKCILGTGFALNGGFKDCSIVSTLVAIDGGNFTLFNCFSNIANDGITELSFNGVGSSRGSILGFKSDLTISDVNNANDLLKIVHNGGKLTLDATCTDGKIDIAGQPYLINNSNGTTVDKLAMSDIDVSAKAVWDYQL